MSLSRTFVGFSSRDIHCYRLMQAWKSHEHIDFNFCDCQAQDGLNSTNEAYIKGKFRARIGMAGTYMMIIGDDTRFKDTYVRWEAEVAIDQGCRIFGVNLDNWRTVNPATCPSVLRNVGAMFLPFSPQIIGYALSDFHRQTVQDWEYMDQIYTGLGYQLIDKRAIRPPRQNLFFQRTLLDL